MFGNRALEIKIAVALVALVLIANLFNLQILDDSYKDGASANAVRHVVQYPIRGEIYDRNGLYLSQSEEACDLMVIPREVEPFDTTLLCNLLEVERAEFDSQLVKAKHYSYHRASIMFKQLPQKIKMRFDEFDFPGFFTQYRTVRAYPYHTAGNILGYVGEVNSSIIRNDDYYKSGDFGGMTGIERAYEKILRGTKGVKLNLVNVHGVTQGSYKEGVFDTLPVAGVSITSTIDLELQKLGEELMKGKRGSIVAIEPSTGEILMMVSSPSYTPDELLGRDRSKNYLRLLRDSGKPLFNRAVMASYPPGSTFKLAVGLVGLQEGVITPESEFSCNGGFYYAGKKLGCHAHKSPLDMYYGIQTSCNAYFCNVYKLLINNPKYGSSSKAFTQFRNHITSMGFGRKLDSDFIGELNGFIPQASYYDRIYRGSWNALTTISNSIGQGEIGVTPLQLANFVASVANEGYYYIPHVIKKIGDGGKLDAHFYDKHFTTIDHKHYESVKEGMWKAVNVEGSARGAYIEGQDVCGKTGTAENPHGKDHSTFAAFAPRNNPKISISVYVENGGFGATIAVPIAKVLLEKYLLGEVKSTRVYKYCVEREITYK